MLNITTEMEIFQFRAINQAGSNVYVIKQGAGRTTDKHALASRVMLNLVRMNR